MAAIHLKETQNSLADFLICQRIRQDEWSLDMDVFEGIMRSWERPKGRPLCLREQQEGHTVLLPPSTGSSQRNRLSCHCMAIQPLLCLSPSETNSCCSPEVFDLSDRPHSDNSVLAKESLVCQPKEARHISSVATPGEGGSCHSGSYRAPSGT